MPRLRLRVVVAVVANTIRRPEAVAVYTIHPEVEESQAEPWAGESRSFRLLNYQHVTRL